MGMASSSEEVGDGNCMSSGTGIKRVTDSVTGVWYDPSVGGDDGGVADECQGHSTHNAPSELKTRKSS